MNDGEYVMTETLKEGDIVRYKGETVVVKHRYPSGLYWVSNLNMPYHGNISDIVSIEELDNDESSI